MGLFSRNDVAAAKVEMKLRAEIQRLEWKLNSIRNDQQNFMERLGKLEHRFRVIDSYTSDQVDLLEGYGYLVKDINPNDNRLKELLDDYLAMQAELRRRDGQ
jgi:hypothetical protein